MAGAINIVLGASIGQFVTGINSARSAVSTFSRELNGNLAASFAASDRQAKVFERGLGRLGANLQSTGRGLSTFLTLPLLAGAGAAVKIAGDMEVAKVSFTTMLGSAEKATSVLGDLQKFAAETPFEFPEIQAAAKSLLAFGISADQLQPTLRALGDVSSGIGAPIGEIAEIYGKARTQGRLFAEDINQLTGRGIPIIQELAKQFGVSETKVKGLVESGAVGFPNLEAAFKSLTSEGGKFSGLMAAQSQTLPGLLSTLRDNFGQGAAAIGADLTETFKLKGVITSLSGFVQTAATGFTELSPASKGAAIAIGAVAAGIGPLLLGIGTFISLIPTFQVGLTALRVGFAALTGPIGLTVLALAAIGTAAFAVVNLNTATKSAYSSALLLSGANRAVAESTAVETANLNSLLAVARNETNTKEQRRAAIAKINALSPEYLGNLTLEGINTAKADGIVKDYIKTIELKARTQFNASKLAEATGKLEEERAKKLSDRVGTLDRLASAGKNLFNSNGKAAVEAEVAAKAVERQNVAVGDLQKTVDFYRRALSLTANEEAKIGKAAPRVAPLFTAPVGAAKTTGAAKEIQTYFEFVSGRLSDFQKQAESFSAKGLAIPPLVTQSITFFTAEVNRGKDALLALKAVSLGDLKPLQSTATPERAGQALNELKGQVAVPALPGLADFTARLDVPLDAAKEKLRQFNVDVSAILRETAVGALTGMGEVIGGLIAGTQGIDALPKALLGTLGGVLKQLGQLAISTAIGIGAIQTALKTLNPVVAAVAGVALIALGTAVQVGASKLGGATAFESGGLLRGPTLALMGETAKARRGGGEYVASVELGSNLIGDRIAKRLTTFETRTPDLRMAAFQPPAMTVNVVGEFDVSGSNLKAVIRRQDLIDQSF